VKQRPADQTTLVSWHHTKIAKIMGALGADRAASSAKWAVAR
jgi:hypothetical protein